MEWHQDWAFYPHSNADVLAVGVMIDDIDTENGPMMVVPYPTPPVGGSVYKAQTMLKHHYFGKTTVQA